MRACQYCGQAIDVNAQLCGVCRAPVPRFVGQPQGPAAVARIVPITGPGQEPPKRSTKAVAGFWMTVSFCACLIIPGFVLSLIARKEIRESNGRLTGEGYALAGIWVGGVILGLSLILGVITAVNPNLINPAGMRMQDEVKSDLDKLSKRLRTFERQNPGKSPESFYDIGGEPYTARYTYFLPSAEGTTTASWRRNDLPDDIDVGDAVVVAYGNIDYDPFLDVWVIDRSGRVHQLQDDLHDKVFTRR